MKREMDAYCHCCVYKKSDKIFGPYSCAASEDKQREACIKAQDKWNKLMDNKGVTNGNL